MLRLPVSNSAAAQKWPAPKTVRALQEKEGVPPSKSVGCGQPGKGTLQEETATPRSMRRLRTDY
jgi:hypothetical protein